MPKPGVVAAAVLVLAVAPAAAAQPWTDATLPPEQRSALLLGAMTQSEKEAMVHGSGAPAYVGNVPGNARLGIPALNLEDGPAGVADGMTGVTAFPAPITVAGSWDPDLAQRFGGAIAAEEAGKGANIVLGPMMNIDRAPAAGRNFEGFGEDPVLSAALAAAAVRGIQGAGLVATAKHYVDNDQETNRTTISAVVDDRTQHEVYLAPFRASVDAGVGAVMCAYNQVGGTFACEDDLTLDRWLKGELAFPGFVMSDWGATHSTVPAALAGLDMEMPSGTYFGPALAGAVSAGSVPAARLDDMVGRLLRSLFAAGIFDRPAGGSPTADVRSAAASQLAADAAAQGTVLLKNDGALLPLDPGSVRSIAVIGAAGDASPVFQGGGSSKVVASAVVTPRQGIAARAGGIAIAYATGAPPSFSDATSLAAASDVAVVVVGTTSSEGADRSSLSLPDPADALVLAVAQANPRTVVVVYAPAQVLLPWADVVPAIVFGGLPGQEEGTALASVLFGDVDPSGKLPMTFARSAGDYPAQAGQQFPGVDGTAAYSEGFLVGYRSFDATGVEPLFPFGHGLSYTTFTYANLVVAPQAAAPGASVDVSFDVTNAGAVAGAEVAQVYLGLPPMASEPANQLKAFRKVTLAPGETSHLDFTLDPASYAFWSAGQRAWVAAPGAYAVRVGSSSRDVRLTGAFVLQGGPLGGGVHPAASAALSCSAALASAESGSSGDAGYVGGFTTAGAAVTFAVHAPVAGPCALTARYAASGTPRTLGVYVNGARVGQATFPPLANLSVWDFETETVDLSAGDNSVAYVAEPGDTGQVLLDEIIDCFGAAASADDDAGPALPAAPPAPFALDGGCAPLPGADAGPGAGGAPSQGFACGCAAAGAGGGANLGALCASLFVALGSAIRLLGAGRQRRRVGGGVRRSEPERTG